MILGSRLICPENIMTSGRKVKSLGMEYLLKRRMAEQAQRFGEWRRRAVFCFVLGCFFCDFFFFAINGYISSIVEELHFLDHILQRTFPKQ